MKKIVFLLAAFWLIQQNLHADSKKPAPPTPPTSQPTIKEAAKPKEADAPLYTLDSPEMPKAADGTKLARILQSQVLRACVRSDVPPFGYFLGRRLVGYDIDLVEQIARRLSVYYKRNLTIEWTVINAGSRISSLQQDTCDIVAAAFSRTKARARLVGFSKVYLKTNKVLISAETTRKNPVLAIVRGTTTPDAQSLFNAEIRFFENYKEIIYAMESGSIDYVITDHPIALHMIRSVSKKYKIVKKLGLSEEYAIGVQLENKTLLHVTDLILLDLAQSGKLAYLQRQWL